MAERGTESENMDRKRKRKKKRREKEEIVSPTVKDSSSSSPPLDPLVVLGSDLVTKILDLLDARSVARLLVLSPDWHRVAISDRIWAPKCEELWMGKAHIPRLSMVRGASKLATYAMCIMDGKRADLFFLLISSTSPSLVAVLLDNQASAVDPAVTSARSLLYLWDSVRLEC